MSHNRSVGSRKMLKIHRCRSYDKTLERLHKISPSSQKISRKASVNSKSPSIRHASPGSRKGIQKRRVYRPASTQNLIDKGKTLRLNSDDKKRKFQTRKINIRVQKMQLAINLPNHMYVNKLKRMFSDEDEPISGGPPMKVFSDK